MKEKDAELEARLVEKEAEIAALRDLVETMQTAMAEQESRIRAVEAAGGTAAPAPLQASLQPRRRSAPAP